MIDFLCRETSDRCFSLKWEASSDMYLCMKRFLLFDYGFRYMFCEKLNVWPGITDNIFYHLVKCITKARHMHSSLSSSKIGIQIELCIEPMMLTGLTTNENS